MLICQFARNRPVSTGDDRTIELNRLYVTARTVASVLPTALTLNCSSSAAKVMARCHISD
jgi:hypothetical protein